MKKTTYLLYLSIMLAGISGCSSITTIPQTENTQTVITNASTEKEAIKIATYQAKSICTLKGKTTKVTALDSIYQGDSKKQLELIQLAKTVLPKNKTNGEYTPKDYTYKVKLTFGCI